jgi:aminobenzoyl-glutamate utilization protein B
VHEYLLNRPIQEALQKNLELIGAPKFTDQEQEFARSLQRFLNKPEKGFNGEIKPMPAEPGEVKGGSTDVAEVSWIVPTGGFTVTTAAEDIPWHSWAATACHGTKAGRKGAVVAAKVIAATALDVLTEPKLVQEARAFFLEATEGKPYQSPIPADQKPPLPPVD